MAKMRNIKIKDLLLPLSLFLFAAVVVGAVRLFLAGSMPPQSWPVQLLMSKEGSGRRCIVFKGQMKNTLLIDDDFDK
jgi:hypothetical protein